MTNDRSYLRALSDKGLIQIAHEGDSELSLVLAERLAERIDDILDAERVGDHLYSAILGHNS